MSRLCVKGLPKDVTEDRLRDVFSQKGEITDVRLLRYMEGKSRHLAFIGFRREEEAHEAIKYFNKSFIDASQISVEVARNDGDVHTPRPWSRNQGKRQEIGVSERGKSKIWSQGTSKEHNKRWSDTESSRKKKVVALSAGVSDVGYFESRVKKNLPDSGSDSDELDDANQELKAVGTGRLIVLNLPYTATHEEIVEHFSKFGEISEVHLFLDKETKRSNGHAYILYSIPESALRAMKTLSNKVFQNRLLSIFPAGNLSKTLKKKTEEHEASGYVPCDTAVSTQSNSTKPYLLE